MQTVKFDRPRRRLLESAVGTRIRVVDDPDAVSFRNRERSSALKGLYVFRSRNSPLILMIGCLAVTESSSHSQDNGMPDYQLDEIVVVADRTEGLLRESPWATSVLPRTTLEQLPVRNVVEALRYVPGLTFVEKDGAGHLPMAVVRGFFGGGEAEYILLTVDGVPTNDVRTGLAEWSRIPLDSIERIEVLRGGGSAVYGDAALGAVVNIVTRRLESEKTFSAALQLGQQGDRRSNLTYQGRFDNHGFRVNATMDEADGFRTHAAASTRSVAGRYDWAPPSWRSYVRWSFDRLRNDDPGPLSQDQVLVDRRQSHSLFSQDERVRDRYEAAAGWSRESTSAHHLVLDAGVNRINQGQTRTLLLTPNFGDTQFHDEQSVSVWSRSQYRYRANALQVVTGVDVERGSYESGYFAPQDRVEALSAGEGHRTRFGTYVEAKRSFAGRWHAVAGMRYDWIRNTHRNDVNPVTRSSFSQWTPRLGINYAYFPGHTAFGHLYVNWTRAFKAPTLDQLYDRREIPTGVPGQTVNLSNTLLLPQTANGFEAGIYQRIPFLKDQLYGEVMLTAYRLKLEDEIDFDLNTFRYGNIQRSRHDGVEGSATLYFLPRLSASTALNVTDVTFRSGDQVGNELKNIPGLSVNTTLNLYLPHRVSTTIAHRYTGETFLDDANSVTLPAYQTFDAKLQWRYRSARFHLLVMNLADNLYNNSGFLLFDPVTFQNVPFFFPAQGRTYHSRVAFLF